MTNEIESRVKRLVAEQLGADEEELNGSSHLQEDLNADPLSIADLIVKLEQEFSIKIPNDQVSNFKTVEDISSFIQDHLGEI
jgi:acyl carrier protein